MPKIKTKQSRRFGQNLRETEDKYFQRKSYPPGQHGKRRRRISEYGKQLMEKQKLKIMYGVREKQFRNYFKTASASNEPTNQELLSLLERRLDNVVYRLGLAVTRAQARQFTSHGHFSVNGRRVTTPSYRVGVGDTIAVRENSQNKKMFNELDVRIKNYEPPVWLSLDKKTRTGTVQRMPGADVLEETPVELAQIVEFYSR